ncbi:MAG TPA: alpha-2-macroglobulin family protein, partial [Phnomibacter sp.]|nr:alpha-2-macroglobulin family protein [Phnomibacter sp.]
PWSNKQLDIQFETFRNKLLHRQQETWKVKVKGAKGEKIAAEMLASMYDASLDQIYPHNWMNLFPWNNYQFGNSWRAQSNFRNEQSALHAGNPEYRNYSKIYDALVTIENDIAYGPKVRNMAFEARAAAAPGMDMQLNETVIVSKKQDEDYDKVFTRSPDQEVHIRGKSSVGVDTKEPTAPAPDQIQIRKNFNETAFFFPALQTDAEGNISFSFTMPEALTQWKLQLLAHTQALQVGQTSATAITQKDLMVQPNAPRFLRQGDKMELAAKVVNLSDKELTGTATLELLNASTMQPVDGWLQNVFPMQYFTAAAGQSAVVKFPVEIPVQYTDALVYRITAKAGNLSDGEEMALPVLSNRMLVTESFPINMRSTNSKNFNWQKLLQSENSPTLQHQSFTIEYTSNPVWLAIQSLPYLAEYPYECAEQTWNRFYANALAAHIAQSFPKVKAVLAKWKDTDTTALLSNLQKNEQLKQALLEETPWVLAAKNENEQRKNLSMLFDVLRLEKESEKSLATLEQLQSPNGGFVWFKGGPDDRYMTQYIISGMGHLRQLKAWPTAFAARLQVMANKGIAYLDVRMK